MIELRFQDILETTGAVLLGGDPKAPIRGISTDSRSIAPGEAFLALEGPNYDGNRFAPDALRRGASGLLLRGTRADASAIRLPSTNAPVALHEAPRRALADLAAWHRGRLDAPVVGITGSCGKTTTKNILVELLRGHRDVVGSPASFNNDIGVPHTLLRANRSTEVLVVEMGTNHPGEIASLCRIARPTGGILTNIGASHLAGLGTIEGVAREKGELAACLPPDGFLVLDADSRFTPELRASTAARVRTFSIEGSGDLDARGLWFESGTTRFRLNGQHDVALPMLGAHCVQNLLAALAACTALGLQIEGVLPAVSRLSSGRRRMERIEAEGLVLFDDTYNANPESARASLSVLAGFRSHGRRVLVLGDMLELGEQSRELHHEIGRAAARAGADLIVLVGAQSRAAADGALHEGHPAQDVLHFGSLDEAMEVVPGMLRDGDVVLVKGSHCIGLDRMVERIRATRLRDLEVVGSRAARI
jgi:UDP-N-acetylmuramoyl-tripeptide--D-alanyl-D-alanine ligase